MAELKRKKMYQSWYDMKRRCLNKEYRLYPLYGGRGITIDEKWLSFENFYNDMQSNFRAGLTLDRIDNNKGYYKNNTRWANMKTQANNRRSNKIIFYKGFTKTLEQWINDLGLKSSTVRQRLYVYKWDIEKCFTFERGVI